jgi:hypothetical protein
MTATYRCVAVVVVAALVAVGSTAAASTAKQAPRAKLAASCQSDRARSDARIEACELIVEFFRAVNGGRYGHACSLLGEQLQLETGGSHCPDWLAFSVPRRFQILRARPALAEVEVFVRVGLPELGHVRLLSWWALVGHEAGRLRILATSRA